MTAFVSGFASVFALLMGVAFWLLPNRFAFSNEHASALLVRGVLAPSLAAWVIAEALNVIRPMRLFDRRLKRRIGSAAAGVAAGLVGAATGSLALALVDQPLAETLVLAGAGALGTALMLAPMGRVRAGYCIHCGYDLRAQPGPGSPGSGVCPECGTRSWPARAIAPH